jgi:putative membrane protein
MHPFARIALVWLSNVVAIWVADQLVDGIRISPAGHVVWVGAVFGLVNWLVKPIVTFLSIPLIIITLGVALFFVNLLMLYITSWILGSFTIDAFWSAVGATIVIWLVNCLLHAVLGLNRRHRLARA